ncbi:ABC transporter substrate-binding protein [Shewanella baltica]|uniref:ABC transporter substrate-binding protein n=1 Tax=Shewanella baltica TaxID=62322 RepID=UPI003D7AB1AA
MIQITPLNINLHCVALLLCLVSLSQNANTAKVIVIESYHHGYQWDQEYYRAINDTLSPLHDVSYFEMDTKRLPKEQFAERADLAWKYIQSRAPQLVILADDNAVNLLHQRLNDSLIPVVYLGVNMNPREYHLNEHKRFTGVIERPLLRRSLLLIQRLLPQTVHRKILVLFDQGVTSDSAAEYISKQHSSILGDIEVNLVQLSQLTDWQQQVLTAKEQGYNAIVVALYHTVRDAENRSVDAHQLLKWISEHTPVPNFGFWGFSVSSEGNIGGYVLDGYHHGELAANMALKILAGEKPENIFPVTDDLGKYMFSQQGLAKWNISLPKEIEKNTLWVK